MSVHLLGVRHHSPACARLVQQVIERVRPATVLVEGPLDFTPRLDELLLPHRLPVALLSTRGGVATWLPFQEHSPEWVALHAARRVGAEARFFDLPAWHEAFCHPRQLGHQALAWVSALRERVGVDDEEALWNHLFELPMPADALHAGLQAWFRGLRGDQPAGPRDAPREQVMSQAIAWAAARGEVVVVCGGWHSPALAWEGLPAELPALTAPPDAQTWVVPLSDRRLERLGGLTPMTGWQQRCWSLGPERVGEAALEAIVAALRAHGHPVSTADRVACHSLADGLARLRGHAAWARHDLLDAVASVFVREVLEAPPPWSQQQRPSHPVLQLVADALRGERTGALAPGTPQPPLLADVAEALATHRLTPADLPRVVPLTRGDPRGVVLHRLRALAAPGFRRLSRPTADDPLERWEIVQAPDLEAGLLAASGWGSTLEHAAGACLMARFEDAADLADVAAAVEDTLGAGLPVEPGLVVLTAAVAQERSLVAWGAGAGLLLDLLPACAALRPILTTAFDRGLWLVEGQRGPDLPAEAGQLRAMGALRDLARTLKVDPERASAVLRRVARADDAPPALRGAALGWVWALGGPEAEAEAADQVGLLRPARLGDWLAGLLALARGAAAASAPLVRAVDRVLATLAPDDFLLALPALRMAMAWLSPAERYAVALAAAALHGRGGAAAAGLLRGGPDPLLVARGAALDAQVAAVLQTWGLA